MLHLLAFRARAALAGSTADPWAGTRLAMERAVGDGRERTPARWMERWPAVAQENFWRSHERKWPITSDLPLPHQLAAGFHQARKKPVVWGAWGHEETTWLGVTPIADPGPLPRSARVVGIVASLGPGGLDKKTLQCIEAAKDQGCQVWLLIPADPVVWSAWEGEHWRQCHRLGVALWLEAPAQDYWSDYVAFLGRATAHVVRQSDWEQWVFPVCDLLEFSFEDLIVYGTPVKRNGLPWAWEGRCKSPDWSRVRHQVWDAASLAGGGAGSLEEVLVATVLAKEELLLP